MVCLGRRWFIIPLQERNNYKEEIQFKTKKDILWEASGNYLDGRKRLTVKRITQGWYVYSPLSCDGDWGSDIVIVNDEAINKYESLKNTFNEFLEQFNKSIEESS